MRHSFLRGVMNMKMLQKVYRKLCRAPRVLPTLPSFCHNQLWAEHTQTYAVCNNQKFANTFWVVGVIFWIVYPCQSFIRTCLLAYLSLFGGREYGDPKHQTPYILSHSGSSYRFYIHMFRRINQLSPEKTQDEDTIISTTIA